MTDSRRHDTIGARPSRTIDPCAQPAGLRPRRRMSPLGRAAMAVAVVGLVTAACSGTDADRADSDSTPVASAIPDTGPVTAPFPTGDEAATSSSAPPETATSEPGPVPSSEPDAHASYDFSATSPIVQSYVDAKGLNGAGLVIVDREDGIVHEEYWGAIDADRVSLVASASKMIVAGVLLHLDDAGLLDIDAPVADVVDWGAANPEITPAQLVSNSSGLVGLSPATYGPYRCQFLPAGTLQDCAEAIFTTPDDDAEVIAPDTAFRYGGGQWQVAGAVAEVASGRSWAELLDEVYVEPCGVDSLAFNNQWAQFGVGFGYPAGFDGDPSTLVETDNPNIEGGAYITAPDYATLLLMQLRDGRCGDEQVLSPEALRRMHSDRTASTYASRIAYGMGWWIDERTGRITDPGAYGAVPWLDLADGYGAYLVVEANGTTGNALAALLYDVVDEAVNAAS